MKTLGVYLESLLDDNDIFFDPENDKKIIAEWIKNNYTTSEEPTISDDLVVNCRGNVKVKNISITSLTNGLFRWGYIGREFWCNGCNDLISLEGAPEKVGMDFICAGCKNIKTLKGAPKEVGGVFIVIIVMD